MSSERIISLKNLFWKIIVSWKRILVVGGLFAILLPCIKYTYDNRMYAIKREALLEMESNMDDETYQKYYKLKENVDIAECNKEFSIYETANLSKVYQMVYEYTFDETVDDAENAANNLVSYYTSGEFANSFAKDCIVTNENCDEIATVIQGIVDASLNCEEEKYYVQISIVYEEEGKIADSTVQYSDLISYIEKSNNENSLIMTSKIKSKVGITKINENRNALQTVIDTEQKRLDDYVKNNNIVEDDGVLLDSPSFELKYALLGFVLGVILICVFVVIKALFTDDLQETEEIQHCYNINTVETLVNHNKGNVIDRKIQKIRYKKNLPIEKALTMFIATQKGKCRNLPVFISSSMGNEVDNEVLTLLEEKFKEEKIEVIIGNSINSNVEDFEKMCSVGNVLFVEELDQSKHEDIEKEIIIARENEVTIMGFLIIT